MPRLPPRKVCIRPSKSRNAASFAPGKHVAINHPLQWTWMGQRGIESWPERYPLAPQFHDVAAEINLVKVLHTVVAAVDMECPNQLFSSDFTPCSLRSLHLVPNASMRIEVPGSPTLGRRDATR